MQHKSVFRHPILMAFLALLLILPTVGAVGAQEPEGEFGSTRSMFSDYGDWNGDAERPPSQPVLQHENGDPYRYFLFAFGAQAPVGQFNFPTGVAVVSDGTTYVADAWNQRIQYFDANGDFLGRGALWGLARGNLVSPLASQQRQTELCM